MKIFTVAQRTVLALRDFLPYEEIAPSSISARNGKIRISAAKSSLREILAPESCGQKWPEYMQELISNMTFMNS